MGCLWTSTYIETHNPKVVFLIETKINDRRIERIRRRCGLVFEFDVFAMGSCGGLSLGWKQDCSIRLRTYSSFHIDVDVLDEVIGYNWRLTISMLPPRKVPGEVINIGQAAFDTTINLLSNTVFSMDLVDPNSSIAREFKKTVCDIMVEAGKPKLDDYFPLLRKIDPQGVRRQMTVHFDKLLNLFGNINERKSSKSKLPPGPWLKPIFGNLFDLGDKPHRSLATLAQIHGPVMTSQHHEYGLPWIPVSPLWRTLRKVCNIHLFTSMKLDANEYLRRHKIQELIAKVGENCLKVDLVDPNSSNAQEFKKIVCDAMVEAGRPNLADYFLCFESLIHKDLFAAGTDTTSSTLEWAMPELLRNPQALLKAKKELVEAIGKGNPVEESDINCLPYLQAIIKETFRMHPAVPLLLPRRAGSDTNLCGFKVPKGSQVLVNVWVIGRDPSIWDNPNSFIPDRFLGSEIDVKSRDFTLIPFGAGRRICPGLPLANRMLHLMLGSLINCFDWKLEAKISPNEMNMEEKYGIAVHMATPLRAIPLLV
ncbi:hypothetical protein GOBAR_AA23486 [Gossypium barbadense]|uniref:Uncharacterized protein n=1 Tax=Gossypium barbadense TaxID=3634 RepID=A0A2P5X1H7_GOSBA|nr:hypothetical protein GOBAR_AA23486 [Gossypium barbadense]